MDQESGRVNEQVLGQAIDTAISAAKNVIKTKYDIVERDVVKHSKVMFKMIRNHCIDLDKVSKIDENSKVAVLIKRTYEDAFCMSAASKYSKGMLQIDKFRVATVYHLCICRLLKKHVSLMEYEFFKMVTEKVMVEGMDKDYLCYETLMLKKFNVDPATLPIKHLQLISSMDESAMASEIILDKLNVLKPFARGDSYDDYYEYMLLNAKKINIALNDKGFYSTHTDESLAIAMISRKMKMPEIMQSGLYKGIDGSDSGTAIEIKKDLQKKIMDAVHNAIDNDMFG